MDKGSLDSLIKEVTVFKVVPGLVRKTECDRVQRDKITVAVGSLTSSILVHCVSAMATAMVMAILRCLLQHHCVFLVWHFFIP